MITIEIDAEVFEYLQSKAQVFVDQPNDVLRRLLFRVSKDRDLGVDDTGNLTIPSSGRENYQPWRSKMPTPIDVSKFVEELLMQKFGSRDLKKKGNYRLMFENEDVLVYVQNFNKASNHLWYRVSDRPWQELQTSNKRAWLCFTYPPDQVAYIIPVRDILERVRKSNWDRDHLEVNIDPTNSRWTELDWKIENYKENIAIK